MRKRTFHIACFEVALHFRLLKAYFEIGNDQLLHNPKKEGFQQPSHIKSDVTGGRTPIFMLRNLLTS